MYLLSGVFSHQAHNAAVSNDSDKTWASENTVAVPFLHEESNGVEWSIIVLITVQF